MRVNPISREEAAENSGGFEPLPAGVYDYEVRSALETTSSTGNAMLKLEVWVFTPSGGRRLVFDYLVPDKAAWKVRQFCESCGLVDQYEAGNLDPTEIEGRTGRVQIAIEPATSEYEAKNKVRKYLAADYLTKQAGAAPAHTGSRPSRAKAKTNDIDDDSIPF